MFNTRSITLDGSQVIPLAGAVPGLTGTNPFTLVMNVREDVSPGAGEIFSKRESNGDGIVIYSGASYVNVFMQKGSTRCRLQTDQSLVFPWQHLVWVSNGPLVADQAVYLNGVLCTVQTIQDDLSGDLSNTEPMYIGRNFAAGMINAAMYGRALTLAEVQALLVTVGSPTPVDPLTLPTQIDMVFSLPLGNIPDNKKTMHDVAGINVGSPVGTLVFSTDVP